MDEKLNKEYQEIYKLQQGKEDEILSKKNVVGVAVGHEISGGRETGNTCLTILVNQKLDPSLLSKSDLITKKDVIGKFKPDVVEIGDIFAGNATEDISNPDETTIQTLKTRVRPAKGGYSVGHFRITAGTLGTCVYDMNPYPGIPGKYYILSNNHVLANSNDAKIGDPILQPGPYDGGNIRNDVIARLTNFVPIDFDGGNNYVDAAIAEGEFHDLDREIYWIGYVKGVKYSPRPPFLPGVNIGDIVQKCGRTTNFTTGKVTQLYASVMVNYGGGRIAKFVRQIITSNMSAGGDSGSLVLDMDGNGIGLLFAGSNTRTILNELFFVVQRLKIRIK